MQRMIETLFQLPEYLVQRPLLLLLLMAVPLLLAVRWKQIYPSKLMLFIFSFVAASSILFTVLPLILKAWFGFNIAQNYLFLLLIPVLVADALLLIVAAVDFFLVVGVKQLSANRTTLRIASLGKPHDVEVELINRSSNSIKVTVKDDLPNCFTATPPQFETTIEGSSRAIFDYKINSEIRGKYSMKKIFVKVQSQLALWEGLYELPVRVDGLRVSGHAANCRIRPAGPHQSAEPRRRETHAENRPRQRVRTTARLYDRRQLQKYRLASDGTSPQVDGQGLSKQPEPADHFHARLRAADDRNVGPF